MDVKKRMKRINCMLICLVMLLTYALGSSVIKALALTDYESKLQAAGFPESYWSYLTALHEQHPLWVFNADKIDLNWDDVVNGESPVGRNLVGKSSIDSWKSFEYGAYDFTKNDWSGLDGSAWIAASKQIITYYLDPRNFLNDSTAFMFMNQNYDESAQTLDGIKKMVSGKFLDASFPEDTNKTYSDIILDAAKQSKVNPYVLASFIIQEQGDDSNGSISGIYKGYVGYYNYFNIGAYAADGMNAVQRGLWWAAGAGSGTTTYNRPWDSRYKSIIGGSIYYGKSYINAKQNTIYYKKFNVINTNAGYYYHQYMTNIQGAESEAKILKTGYANVSETALVFNIPVFNNMPNTAVTKPTSTGNNNNLLTSLSVNGYSLTPTYTMYTTEYDTIVDKNTYSINISAQTSDSGASISSPLTVSLKDGDNVVPVVVCAPSGVTRTYTLNIYKMPNDGNNTSPSISSNTYTISSYISNVSPDTSVNDFLSKFSVSNASVNVVDSSGNTKSGIVATGDKLQVLQNNSIYSSYDVSVNGDINGDGKLSSYDLLKIQKHILKLITLTGIELASADYNKDEKISSFDLLKVQKYILKL